MNAATYGYCFKFILISTPPYTIFHSKTAIWKTTGLGRCHIKSANHLGFVIFIHALTFLMIVVSLFKRFFFFISAAMWFAGFGFKHGRDASQLSSRLSSNCSLCVGFGASWSLCNSYHEVTVFSFKSYSWRVIIRYLPESFGWFN